MSEVGNATHRRLCTRSLLYWARPSHARKDRVRLDVRRSRTHFTNQPSRTQHTTAGSEDHIHSRVHRSSARIAFAPRSSTKWVSEQEGTGEPHAPVDCAHLQSARCGSSYAPLHATHSHPQRQSVRVTGSTQMATRVAQEALHVVHWSIASSRRTRSRLSLHASSARFVD